MEFILAFRCLEFSPSTYMHGFLCHFNRSSSHSSLPKPCLTTLIPGSTFCYCLGFHTAFISLLSSRHCLIRRYTYLFISSIRTLAQLCGGFESPFHYDSLSVQRVSTQSRHSRTIGISGQMDVTEYSQHNLEM